MSATQLYYSLVWPKEPPPLVDHLFQVHLATLEGWLDEVIWFIKHNEPAFHEKFFRAVGLVSHEERRRFLSAPGTFPF